MAHIDVKISEQPDGTTLVSWDEPGVGEVVYTAPKGTQLHDIMQLLSDVGTPSITKVRRGERSH